MILTTTPSVEGRTIVEYNGIVFGEVITGINFIKERSSEGEPARVEMEVERPKLPGDKKLEFLASALKRYNISREDVQPKMNIGTTTIYYWLSHDDVFISYMYKFAEVTGLKFAIKITPNKNAK